MAPDSRYATLPPRIRPEDTVEEVASSETPAPETGDALEMQFVARFGL